MPTPHAARFRLLAELPLEVAFKSITYHLARLNPRNPAEVLRFNAQVEAINQESARLQSNVDTYNGIIQDLVVRYDINPNPVKTVEVWWP